LTAWLDGFNQTTRELGEGPIIELVPLPTSAQFLNVIEGILSGMTRAVINNFDYSYPDDMRAAISRHFAERNKHFSEETVDGEAGNDRHGHQRSHGIDQREPHSRSGGAGSPRGGRGKNTVNAETTLVPITPDTILAREMARFVGDPLGFVLFAYPWGRAGTELEHEMGPDPVQKKFLTDLGEHVKRRKFRGTLPVMPIMMTATSGHGTGKSVLGSWIGW
jgi:hypothetical protein